tara:strand:- start:126 stop:473 length:348 start_codon:yes stop_codon:yes gene_type:complete
MQGTNPTALAKRYSRGSVSEFTGTILKHLNYQGDPAMEVNWVHVNNKSHGKAIIPYVSIQNIWRYGGEKSSPIKNRTPTEDRTVVSTADTWPYTAEQFPPMDIYREKIVLRWAVS